MQETRSPPGKAETSFKEPFHLSQLQRKKLGPIMLVWSMMSLFLHVLLAYAAEHANTSDDKMNDQATMSLAFCSQII